MILPESENPIQLSSKSILLLSDVAHLKAVEITKPLCGVCLSICTPDADKSLKQLQQTCGFLPFSMKQTTDIISRHGGYYAIHPQPWVYGGFCALESLSPAQQGYYCTFKCFELFYLLNIHFQQIRQNISSADQLNVTAEKIQTYLLEHIAEKVTITQLSRLFHLSPTACKNCFQSYTGEPIHHWLMHKRMAFAAKLLEGSNLTVLQIAQAVGYEGTSQFNTLFKQHFGVSPRQYRKNVFSC